MRQIQPIPVFGHAQQTLAFNEDVRREINRTMSYKFTSTDYSTKDESFIGIDSASGVVTITISSDNVYTGKAFVFKDTRGLANTNNITIATEGSETIDGVATQAITANYGSIKIFSNGINWFII